MKRSTAHQYTLSNEREVLIGSYAGSSTTRRRILGFFTRVSEIEKTFFTIVTVSDNVDIA
jgi:hypothetical protein